jgi:hypothetical protein
MLSTVFLSAFAWSNPRRGFSAASFGSRFLVMLNQIENQALPVAPV